jgi:hypothetical protein
MILPLIPGAITLTPRSAPQIPRYNRLFVSCFFITYSFVIRLLFFLAYDDTALMTASMAGHDYLTDPSIYLFLSNQCIYIALLKRLPVIFARRSMPYEIIP